MLTANTAAVVALALLSQLCLATPPFRQLQDGSSTSTHEPQPGAGGTPWKYAPYDLTQIDTLEQLLWAHRTYQTEALRNLPGVDSLPAAVLVVPRDDVGLGNRLPSIVTGFVIAMLSRRVLLIDSWSVLRHLEPSFPAAWHDVAPAYANASRCKFGGIDGLADLAPTAFCGDPAPAIYAYTSLDYDTPLLQINPHVMATLQRLIPDGEVFHRLSRHLLQPTPWSMKAVLPYMHAAPGCLVGLHMRTKKYKALNARQFARIAAALARGRNGSVFVASDAGATFDQMTALLPNRTVWWSNMTRNSVDTMNTRAGNPGTELSAVVDLLLLARCQNIVLTPASTLGGCAAGMAGVLPVFATFGAHDEDSKRHPFLNPWYWRSITSEPCFGKRHTLPFCAWDVPFMPRLHPTDIPRQTNGYDCGMFALLFANRLGLGRPFDFRQPDLEVDARVVVVNQLLAGRVPVKQELP